MLLSCEDDAELSEETSELLSDEISEEVSEVLSEKLSELSSEREAEELSKIFSEELLVKIPELSKEISGSSEEESCCEAKSPDSPSSLSAVPAHPTAKHMAKKTAAKTVKPFLIYPPNR